MCVFLTASILQILHKSTANLWMTHRLILRYLFVPRMDVATKRSRFAVRSRMAAVNVTYVSPSTRNGEAQGVITTAKFLRKNPETTENIKLFALILEFTLHSDTDHWQLLCVCTSYFRTKMETMHNFCLRFYKYPLEIASYCSLNR